MSEFKILFFLTCILFLSDNSYSQVDPEATGYYTDALRFSQTMKGGTARFQSMGGVNTALGADLSSLSGNPAGLGFYKKSEVSLSPALGFAGTSSAYLGATTEGHRESLNFPNLGAVFTGRKSEAEEGIYRGGAFGIGLTRINNFQNQFRYSGINNKNSMTDYFVDISNGIPEQEFFDEYTNIKTLQGLAFWTYLIDTDPNDPTRTQYVTFNKGYSSRQEETSLTRGAINQWNFSYGGNFDDKVYVGASLGVPIIRYISEKAYKETIFNNDTIDNFRFNELLKIKGTGINFKVGVIVKPQDWLRVGVTLQSPTYYSINEEYAYGIRSVFKGVATGQGYYLTSENEKTMGIYKYNLVTPFRASAGVAMFAGKAGFIAADIEYVPYSHIKLKESSSSGNGLDGSYFEGDNNTINNIYRSVVNLNIGGELRYKIYRFRGGFAMLGDAYNNIDDVNRKVINITGGIGLRMDDYYFDVALIKSRYNSIYKPYTLNNGEEPTAIIKNKNTNIIITAGVFF